MSRMRNDLSMHRYLADRQAPPRPPPAQVIRIGDKDANKVKVVFVSSGKKVPWEVTYVNCPERYLMRHQNPRTGMTVREDGDFRVEWDD